MELLINDILVNLLYAIAILVGGFLAVFVQKLNDNEKIVIAKNKLNEIKEIFGIKAELAEFAVLYAQNAFKHLEGEKRYQQALIWLKNRLVLIGLHYTEDELEGLIKRAYVKAKEAYKDQF